VIVVDEIPRAPTGKLLRRVPMEREPAAPARGAGAASTLLSFR
jgi:acyl-CoA synthetase (AMP-forming)/AMP-acid ligase II